MEKSNNLAVPIAIVIAGLLIGGAVLLRGTGSTSQPEHTNEKFSDLPGIVKKMGLDVSEFKKCLAENRYQNRIENDFNAAVMAGGTGTPYTVIITPRDNKIPIGGAQPQELVSELIAAALDETLIDNESSLLKDDTLRDRLMTTYGYALPDSFQEIPVDPILPTDHLIGSKDASVVVVEFSDIDCPFCALFHTTMRNVIEPYETTGQVAWVYRHFPLTQLHPEAGRKAEAMECVAEIGGNEAFWDFADILFSN